MPLLGETGCRLSEIVGLSLEDIDLENELILIFHSPSRRLKTKNSKRELPLVGYAKLAIEEVSDIQMESIYSLGTSRMERARNRVSISTTLKRNSQIS